MDIHRCRFVQYPPSAINALAFSHPSAVTPSSKKSQTPSTLRLALGRANGEIEIWNPCDGIWNQETILHSGKDRSIEGLAWVQDPEDVDNNGLKLPGKLRLFSIGYSTSVTEWDLAEGKPIRHSGGNYGEIWCMAAQPRITAKPAKQITNGATGEVEAQCLAVGCADGAIVLHSTADGDLRFKKLVARASKKGSRVLSITFQNQYTVITGHADSTIRVWDIRDGRQVRNITLGAGPKGAPRETLVWSVRCLSDGSLVSGDSTGMMCFWDGKTYSLTQRIRAHDADILDVAVSVDGQSVFSGGMDRKTIFYRRSGDGTVGGSQRWAKMSHSRMHDHDVKTIAAYESKNLSILASGGLDTYPIIVPLQEYGREYFRRLGSLPQQPPMLSVPQRRLVISWWDREINIWSIPNRQNDNSGKKEKRDWKLVAKAMLTGDESIASLSVTPTGSLLAVSTITSTKTFRISYRKDGSLKLQKLAVPSSLASHGARILQFSPNSRWLCTILPNDEVRLYEVQLSNPEDSESTLQYSENPVTLRRISRTAPPKKPTHGTLGNYNRSINRVSFSAGSDILAISDLSGYLDTWILRKPTQAISHIESTTKDTNMSSPSPTSSSADSSSSDPSDSEAEPPNPATKPSDHWHPNPSGPLLPKLPGAVTVLSFRPSSPSSPKEQPEDRLLVLTPPNRLLEFHVLTGKLTPWSRRNPPSIFPSKYQAIRDQAKGVIWDIRPSQAKERVWVYGISWLWMFDLRGDVARDVGVGLVKYNPESQPQHPLQIPNGSVDNTNTNGSSAAILSPDPPTTTDRPNPPKPEPQPDQPTELSKSQSTRLKRKRNKQAYQSTQPAPNTSEYNETLYHDHRHHPSGATSGAGDFIAPHEIQGGLGYKLRRIDGTGEEHLTPDDSNKNNNHTQLPKRLALPYTAANGDADADADADTDADMEDEDDAGAGAGTAATSAMLSLRGQATVLTPATKGQSFHSFHYRPILGIVPISCFASTPLSHASSHAPPHTSASTTTTTTTAAAAAARPKSTHIPNLDGSNDVDSEDGSSSSEEEDDDEGEEDEEEENRGEELGHVNGYIDGREGKGNGNRTARKGQGKNKGEDYDDEDEEMDVDVDIEEVVEGLEGVDGIEVVLVERPLWDLELPGRFEGEGHPRAS